MGLDFLLGDRRGKVAGDAVAARWLPQPIYFWGTLVQASALSLGTALDWDKG
jgi:hypothetical protein